MVWGYGSDNGPSKWHVEYPVATEGKRQSPIDIATSKAASDSGLKKAPLKWSYTPANCKTIENTGASFMVAADGAGSSLTGGPLGSKYELWQFHAHWGKCCGAGGSEHTVDGKQYEAELHLVHWNKEKYESPSEAAGKSDGLAVLGIFLQVGDSAHSEFDKVAKLLPQIKYKGDKLELPVEIEPANFLSGVKDYYTYDGSLTTPPLLESVTWIVFSTPMSISKDQMSRLYEMNFCCKGDKDECMVDNFRPPVAVGDRTVRKCE